MVERVQLIIFMPIFKIRLLNCTKKFVIIRLAVPVCNQQISVNKFSPAARTYLPRPLTCSLIRYSRNKRPGAIMFLNTPKKGGRLYFQPLKAALRRKMVK